MGIWEWEERREGGKGGERLRGGEGRESEGEGG